MAVNQMILGPGALNIGAEGSITSLASQVTKCELVPDADTGDDIPVLSGEVVAGDLEETWTLKGEFLQDFGVADKSISEWTFTNRGKVFPFTFTPRVDGKRAIRGRLRVMATNIGGDVKKNNSAKFEFSIVGDPELIANPADPTP